MAYIGYQMKANFKYVLVKFIIRSIYFALLMMAMLSPSFGDIKKEIQISEKEIFFCVDVSRSMSVKDVQPNRLLKTKSALKSVVESLSSDKLGLIIFAKDAYIQCPLTSDKEAIKMFIETINEDLLIDRGTDFVPAIELATSKLKSSNPSENTAKIIVLLSDGEDFGDNISSVLELAEKQHIRIYTVGIGTDKGGKIPYGKAFALDDEGNLAISQLQKKELKNIARVSNGKYYEINENINETERLVRDIEQLKGIVTDTKIINIVADKYFYFLFIALLLIIFDILVTFKTIKL
jgi:Ca-activated chloride channel family protein